MQDSIEDYIRITRNAKEEPQVKKEVLITAQIKKECDAKAMQILQFAIEGRMRSDTLFKCLPFINQSHYQDIVEERAISKLCGYPLCSKKIPDMPKKQFFISTKNNKVYDITDRKNYCSNYCYRASIHVKDQIDTSPLWLRKYNERAHFTLLNKTEKGFPGEVVVDQGVAKPVLEPRFTSVSVFAEMSLDEAEELELNPQEEESKTQIKKPKKFQKNPMKTINENEEEEQAESELKNASSEAKPDKVMKEIIPKCLKKSSTTPQVTKGPDPESHLKKCFKEWLTLETYIFIYGEEKVKEKLNSQKLGQYFESLKIAELQIEQQKRYIDICKKLHLRELAEEKFDNAVVGNRKFEPIPDYQQLKAESKEADLKVKAFFSGELHVQADSNFPTKKEEDECFVDEGPPAVLPLVDVNSQTALRRKVFLNSLNKTVDNTCRILRISPSSALPDLQNLVKTFALKADNIVFKPPMWNCIAVALFKILSLRDDGLREILDEENSKTHIKMYLSPIPNPDQFILTIMEMLSDINSFVEDYITCK